MDANYIPVIGIDRLRMATDGKGIRTLIGTFGCTLRCKYCLNPHSWNSHSKPMIFTPEQLYNKVRIDNLYFQSTGGGLTIGGGEPLLYMPAIEKFAALCPETWSLWAETALNVNQDLVTKAGGVFQHFIVDIKTTDAAIYKSYTGMDLKNAFDNLLYLKNLVGSERITVRVPVIPGYTDSEQQLESINLLTSMGFSDIDVFTYRTDVGIITNG